MSRVCVVSSAAGVAEFIVPSLEHEGHEVLHAPDVGRAASHLADWGAELLVLDFALPGATLGLQSWRAQGLIDLTVVVGLWPSRDPVVMELARTLGVREGLSLPCALQALLHLIEDVLAHRSEERVEQPLELADLRLDPRSRRVLAGGRDVHLGPTEFRLLQFLLAHPDRVHSRERLVERLWGVRDKVSARTVDVHVKRLRKALGSGLRQARVETVRGAGYRLSAPRLN